MERLSESYDTKRFCDRFQFQQSCEEGILKECVTLGQNLKRVQGFFVVFFLDLIGLSKLFIYNYYFHEK